MSKIPSEKVMPSVLLIFYTPGTPEAPLVEALLANIRKRHGTAMRPVTTVRAISRLSSVLGDLELMARHMAKETFVGIYLGASAQAERWVTISDLAAAFEIRL